MDSKPDAGPARPIAEVERETGLPRATLRIWERRYGFPQPGRDDRGERSYPPDQVELLRLIRELVERGHRPGKLLASGPERIRELAETLRREAGEAAGRSRAGARMLRLLRQHDAAQVRAELESLLEKQGLRRFASEHLPGMNRLVGQSWASGELQIHEEHLYSDCVYEVVRGAIARLQDNIRPEAPQVLLTTFPNEPHGIGLLMAQAVFALEGCPTISLGVRLPIEQIVSAARAYGAELVGLSFAGAQNPAHVLRGLEELRGMLPPDVRIWAGGECAALKRRVVAGVRVIGDVRDVPALLAEDFALPPQAAG